MATTQVERKVRWSGWRWLAYGILLALAAGLALVALVWIQPSDLGNMSLQEGAVAPVDILASYSITYESEVLTAQQRDAAAQAIPPSYTTPDTRIARQQVDLLRATLTYVSATRADAFASTQQKIADLTILQGVHISPELAETLLALPVDQWETIQEETVLVLQQVMRSSIREGQVEDARRSIPALVSLSLSENHAKLVVELAGLFVTSNSFYSQELTDAQRELARLAVAPVVRSFVKGETVVRRGKVLNAADLEALQQLGLLKAKDNRLNLANAGLVVALSFSFSILYLRRRKRILEDLRRTTFLVATFLIFLFAARWIVPGHVVLPYLYPMAAFSLLLSALFGMQAGLALGLPLSLMITYGFPNALELTLYYTLSSMFGVLVLGRAHRIASYFWAGMFVSLVGVATLLTYRLLDPFTDLAELATLAGASLANGAASMGLTMVLQFFAAQMLGLATSLQLLELSRPDRPLLRFILLNAPGTYQHSLQVANLAEQAAELIGADALLTRIGALYHDAGKALNPQSFIENQVPGAANIHNTLSPQESAAIIIRHVTDGLELAKKYRLPARIHGFIAEHHGTMSTSYQYVLAVRAVAGDESQVDKEEFRYPGPRPQSRETALVMLADGCEARARAERPKSEADLQAIIQEIIHTRLLDGQLDETTLTTQDLHTALLSFTGTLRGIYHPRIEYPKLSDIPGPAPRATQPDAPALPSDDRNPN